MSRSPRWRGWLRPFVRSFAAGDVVLHQTAVNGQVLWPFVLVPTALIGLLAVVCLNRILLHAVAWIVAGATANLGELLATGSVADYVPVGNHRLSPSDLYLSVGFGLLALGAIKVVYDGRSR